MSARDPIIEELPLMRVGELVLFPATISEVRVSSERLAFAPPLEKGAIIAIFEELESIGALESATTGPVGTAVRIREVSPSEDGVALVVEGLRRVRLECVVATQPYKTGRVAELKDGDPEPAAFELAARLRDLLEEVVGRELENLNEVLAMTRRISPGALADIMAANSSIPVEWERWLLRELSPATRLAWHVNRLEAMGAAKRFSKARAHASRFDRAYSLLARLERAWTVEVPLPANEVLTRLQGQVMPFNSREITRYGGHFDPVSKNTQVLFVPGREIHPRNFARRFEAIFQVSALTPTTSHISARLGRDYSWWVPGAMMFGGMAVMSLSLFATSFTELLLAFVVASSISWITVRSICAYRLARFVESDKAAAVRWLTSSTLGPYRAPPNEAERAEQRG